MKLQRRKRIGKGDIVEVAGGEGGRVMKRSGRKERDGVGSGSLTM
jgi:hypothetical protein